MNVHKTCQLKDFPIKIITMNVNNLANFIILNVNRCVDIGESPQEFKHADITPLYENYRQICQHTSKPF